MSGFTSVIWKGNYIIVTPLMQNVNKTEKQT